MQRSASIREELDAALAGMSPSARAVFNKIESRNDDSEPEFSEEFDALTHAERASLTEAAELLKGLVEAESADDIADTDRSARISRRDRRLWIASAVISVACLIAVSGILIYVYTAPTTPDPADTVVT